MRRTLLTVALAVLIAVPAFAQQPLKLSFHDGRVTVDATSVPVRTILTEWGKIGGTKIVGAERLAGAPLTVKLVNVTEAQALETILRSVAGYMAAPRTPATTGPSIYDRILVMATSSTPAPASAARPSPAQPGAFAGTQRFIPPRLQQRPEPQEQEEADEPDENPPSPPVFTFPAPGQQPGAATPGTNVNPPSTITINPAQTTPGQPAFPAGVAQPGMIVPPPTPPPGVRPPGGK